jgi:ferric enterobactin receptor
VPQTDIVNLKCSVLFLLLFFVSNVQAQKTTTVSGTVREEATNTPIEYASVSLFAASDLKVPVNGTTSDAQGHFLLKGIAAGQYIVVVEFIGYQPLRIPAMTISSGQAILDLQNLVLKKKSTTMQTVVVTGQARLIENRIDKLIFNAEKDLTSQVGSATDLLRKVPQVAVDADGNVSLAGNSSIKFLIDGKPSSAFGSNIADVLQALPASQIKSIEVVTNPGARYDAEGLGGIINIILKKSTARGINGSLSVTAGTRMETGSLNISARHDKLGVNAFLSGNLRPYVTTPTSSLRRSFDATGSYTLSQAGSGELFRHSYQAGLGFDWSPADKNSFSGNLTFNRFGVNGSSAYRQDQKNYDASGALTDEQLQRSNGRSLFRFHDLDAGLVYKRKFAREDEELEISAYTTIGTRNSESQSTQYMLPLDSLIFGNHGVNPGTEDESEIEINYNRPLKKDMVLGLGADYTYTSISSQASVEKYLPASGLYKYDPYLSNSLRYKQHVYALYAELSFPLGKLLEAKLGGRYERTERSSFYSNAPDRKALPGYNTVVPSVFLSHKFGEKQ